MPRGSSKGERRGGREKGKPNKKTQDIQEKLDRLECDPHEGMAIIAMNKLPCGVCRGKLKTKCKLPEGSHAKDCAITQARLIKGRLKCTCDGFTMRVCESCYETGYEACSPELRGKMYAELAAYISPKRKAIEHTGPNDGPIQAHVTVSFVKALNAGSTG